jgi:hypothetical protein
VRHGLAAIHHRPAAAADEKVRALLAPHSRQGIHRGEGLAHVLAAFHVEGNASSLKRGQQDALHRLDRPRTSYDKRPRSAKLLAVPAHLSAGACANDEVLGAAHGFDHYLAS